MAARNGASDLSGAGGGLDRDLSMISKESTMSLQMDSRENTQASLEENVFEDAKRALAPSGMTPKQFVGPDGSVR